LVLCYFGAANRAHSDQFYITQEFKSYMLGVHRAGVTAATGLLRERQLIRYSREQIPIFNRRGLQGAACTCYAAARDAYASVLG